MANLNTGLLILLALCFYPVLITYFLGGHSQIQGGFDRSVYGNKKTISNRKWRWFEELRQERERDIKIETTEK
jgi:hypothetical protein